MLCNKWSKFVLIEGQILYFLTLPENVRKGLPLVGPGVAAGPISFDGLLAIDTILGHKSIPGGLTDKDISYFWKTRKSAAGFQPQDLIPGDQILFRNTHNTDGKNLLRTNKTIYDATYNWLVNFYMTRNDKPALRKPRPEAEAAAMKDMRNYGVGEEGCNEVYLGIDGNGDPRCAGIYAHLTPTFAQIRESMALDTTYVAWALANGKDPLDPNVIASSFPIDTVNSPVDPDALWAYGSSLGWRPCASKNNCTARLKGQCDAPYHSSNVFNTGPVARARSVLVQGNGR